MNEFGMIYIIIVMLHSDATKHIIKYLIGLIFKIMDNEKDGS